MLVALCMMSMIVGQQPAPPPQAPAFIRADIVKLSEALELEPSQRDSLRLLLVDHELKWTRAQGSVVANVRQTPAWALAQRAKLNWQAASAQSTAAHRAVEDARRQSLTDPAYRQSLAHLRLALDAAKDDAAAARTAMFRARQAADPGRATLFAQLAAMHALLSEELDNSIAALLDAEQLEVWPTARRAVRRARRLRSLGLVGADIDLRGHVLRRMAKPNDACEAQLVAWATDTDNLLDRIDALQLEANLAKDDVLAASILRDAHRLQVVQADRTLQLAAAIEQLEPSLQGMHASLRAKAYPLTWGSSSLHALAAAAKRTGDLDLLQLLEGPIADYADAIETRAEDWQAIERAGCVGQLMLRRGLSKEAVDVDALQAAGDAQRRLASERAAYVQSLLRIVLQSTSRDRILRVLPRMPLPTE